MPGRRRLFLVGRIARGCFGLRRYSVLSVGLGGLGASWIRAGRDCVAQRTAIMSWPDGAFRRFAGKASSRSSRVSYDSLATWAMIPQRGVKLSGRKGFHPPSLTPAPGGREILQVVQRPAD